MTTEAVYPRYLENLLGGRREECHTIIEDLVKQSTPVHDIYVHLFQRSMYEVGELWECNKVSVATEHLATAVTESLMTLLYPQIFGAEHCGKSAIVAAVVNEYHQIGAKMVADIFELNGWNGFFLGANTPVADLLQDIAERSPEILALSMSISDNLGALKETVEQVHGSFPNLPILVGGQGFRWVAEDITREYPYLEYVQSLERLEDMLQNA